MRLYAFTPDREDIARAQELRWTLSIVTRDMPPRMEELASFGIETRVIVGFTWDPCTKQ